jgi:hypothetical protein
VRALVQAGRAVAQPLILRLAAQRLGSELLLLELRQRLRQLMLALRREGLLDPHREHVTRRAAVGAA